MAGQRGRLKPPMPSRDRVDSTERQEPRSEERRDSMATTAAVERRPEPRAEERRGQGGAARDTGREQQRSSRREEAKRKLRERARNSRQFREVGGRENRGDRR